MTIGKKIKQLRAERGLSQLELARRAEVSQQLISQIENEVNFASVRLPQIAAALGVPVSAIDINYGDTTDDRTETTQVPVLSQEEIIAGVHKPRNDQYVALSDLRPGDWIAMMMTDDAMDRVAPAGALIVANRSDRVLEDGGLYMFSTGRVVFCRRYRAGKAELLMPFSINPEHIAMAYERQQHALVGRVRRSVLEL